MRASQDEVTSVVVPGDSTESFTTWVRPHWDHMLRFAQRLVGDVAFEDVVQEALAAAWRSRRRFDAARGDARTWLLAIVANKAKNHHSRLRPGAELTDLPGAELDASSELDLSRAVESLPHRQREAVALFYYLGLPVAECAAVMGCSDGTVKSTLSDARHNLAKILGEDYQ